MIHWGFLILAFIAGFASCYGIIYRLSKLYDELMGAIEEATKSIGLDDYVLTNDNTYKGR